MPNVPMPSLHVVLQTRCGCEKAMEIKAYKPPRTVTMVLAPVPPQLGGTPDQKEERRVFYLIAKGKAKVNATGEDIEAYLYIEGPNPDRPRIVIPGSVPVDQRIMEGRR